MRKVVLVLMIAVMLLQCAGCSKEKEQVKENNNVTISNPYVTATDSDIYEELGISMYAAAITSVQSEYIVGGSFTQIDFLLSDTDGNDVKACLRAKKDKAENESLHGLHFEDMSEVEILDNVVDGTNVSYTTCDGGNWKIYEWSFEDVSYTFTYSGEVSQTQVSAALDQVMAAVGILEESAVGTMYNVAYELGDVEKWFIETPQVAQAGSCVELKTEVLYDADVHVYVDGEEIEKSHYDSDYWGYSFIMPEKDVTVSAKPYTKYEVWGK